MKVELQCGDSITIPEGCKAIVKDGCVVFEKGQEFKDGDVLVVIIGDVVCPFIFFKASNGFCYYHFLLRPNGEINRSWFFNISILEYARHATELEKQLLFNKMKEQGLQWNAEEKKVEKIRWRANMNEYYYFVSPIGTTCKSVVKNGLVLTSLERYEFFNQFRTEEQTTEAAKRVKETLRKYHEEIGE